MLVQDVSSCNSNIEQEAENEFFALRAASVVAAALNPPIYSSHVLDVLDDGLWAFDRISSAVQLSPQYGTRCLGLSSGGHHCNILSILPETCSDLSFLNSLVVTPLG